MWLIVLNSSDNVQHILIAMARLKKIASSLHAGSKETKTTDDAETKEEGATTDRRSKVEEKRRKKNFVAKPV